jgi:hypothetical protein
MVSRSHARRLLSPRVKRSIEGWRALATPLELIRRRRRGHLQDQKIHRHGTIRRDHLCLLRPPAAYAFDPASARGIVSDGGGAHGVDASIAADKAPYCLGRRRDAAGGNGEVGGTAPERHLSATLFHRRG